MQSHGLTKYIKLYYIAVGGVWICARYGGYQRLFLKQTLDNLSKGMLI